jgi:hypothetical protein
MTCCISLALPVPTILCNHYINIIYTLMTKIRLSGMSYHYHCDLLSRMGAQRYVFSAAHGT